MVVASAAATLRRRTPRPDRLPGELMARLRIAVTGRHGQVARSLVERAAGTDIDFVPIGRPALDLANPETIESALAAPAADVLVGAAAYTDVNQAESERDLADRINGYAAGLLASHA